MLGIEGVWPEYNISKSNISIVAYDFGIKTNILRLLSDHVGDRSCCKCRNTF